MKKVILILAICLLITSGPIIKIFPINNSLAQEEPISEEQTQEEVLKQEQAELEKKIDEQNQRLKEINEELAQKEKELQNTRDEKSSLQREINTIKNNISQLNLNIKADKINIEKLNLEINSLNYDIRDIELAVGDKEESVGEILRKIQRNGNQNFLTFLLKGNSLADSLLESQTLVDISSQLSIEIEHLKEFHTELNEKVAEVDNKKNNIERNTKNLEYRKVIVQDQESEKQIILEQTKNKEAEYQDQVEELRKIQDEIAGEISNIEDELRSKFDVSLLPIKRPGVLEWPIALKEDGGIGIITQHFGEISSLYGGKPHNGLDIGVPVGTPVVSTEDGIVIAVDNNDQSSWQKYQYGKHVLIEHNNNLATIYAHLSKQVVNKGDIVKRGDIIGYSGNTGYSTGPHLHFGVYWAPSIILKAIPPARGVVPVGVVIDPEDYL